MQNQKIVILVNEDGSYEIEVFGAKGTECEALTKDLMKALGTVTETRQKPEYFIKPTTATISTKF